MSAFDCMECYPRLCRCALRPEDELDALLSAIHSEQWGEVEKKRMLQRILELELLVQEV